MKRGLLFILALLNICHSYAQDLDYETAMDDIIANQISDYPEATVHALDELFEGVDVENLPVWERFLYYYYYGMSISDIDADKGIRYLTKARTVAASTQTIGLRNTLALDAECQLADLHMSLANGFDEQLSAAMILYSDVITVGVSLLDDPDILQLVIRSFIEQAKVGTLVWDDRWIEMLWMKARNLALEFNDSAAYSYYVINVMNYYCDRGDYDTAMTFLKDARKKELLQVDVEDYCNWLSETLALIENRKNLDSASIEYWSNELSIAERSTVLCSRKVAINTLESVLEGLRAHGLTASYEYAEVVYLLVQNTLSNPAVAEQYCLEQVNVLDSCPRFFIYTTDADAYNLLGVCQMKLGKYTDADRSYRKALECLERDAEHAHKPGYQSLLYIVYHNSGRNFYFLKDYDRSMEYLNRSIEIQMKENGSALRKTELYLSETLKATGDR